MGLCRSCLIPALAVLSQGCAAWAVQAEPGSVTVPIVATYTLKLTSPPNQTVGSVQILDRDDGRLLADLSTPEFRAKGFPLHGKCLYKIQYLDAPDSAGGTPASRCHHARLALIDSEGRALPLESSRLVAPGSNVFVRPTSLLDSADEADGLRFNIYFPGDIWIDLPNLSSSRSRGPG